MVQRCECEWLMGISPRTGKFLMVILLALIAVAFFLHRTAQILRR
jgi:hypothetical protein